MSTLADIYTNQAGLRAALRAAVGYPNDSVLTPDASVDEALRRGLRKLNDMAQQMGVGTFTTVADQQVYSPLPANSCRLRKVWWPNAATTSLNCQSDLLLLSSGLSPYFGLPLDELGTRVTTEPSAIFLVQRQWAWLKKLVEVSGQILGDDIYLVPAPAEDGIDVYFTYDTDRYDTELEVGTCHMRAFWAAVEGEMHRFLASGAGAVSKLDDPVVGTSVTTVAPAHHLKLAKECDRIFSREFGHPTFAGGWP